MGIKNTQSIERTNGDARPRNLNAMRHGLLSSVATTSGEDPEQLEALRAGIMEDLRPVGLLEHELAQRAVSCMWRLRRIAAVEVEVIEELARQADYVNLRAATAWLDQEGQGLFGRKWVEKPDMVEHGKAFTRIIGMELQNRLDGVGRSVARGLVSDGADKAMALIRRYETSMDRSLALALAQLEQIQSNRKRREAFPTASPLPQTATGEAPANCLPQIATGGASGDRRP